MAEFVKMIFKVFFDITTGIELIVFEYKFSIFEMMLGMFVLNALLYLALHKAGDKS